MIDFVCYVLTRMALLLCICAYLLLVLIIIRRGYDKDGKHDR